MKSYTYNKTNKKGFTLIELLVVIAIIALFSAVVFISIKSARAKTRDAIRAQDIQTIYTMLHQYDIKYGGIPKTDTYGSSDGFIPKTDPEIRPPREGTQIIQGDGKKENLDPRPVGNEELLNNGAYIINDQGIIYEIDSKPPRDGGEIGPASSFTYLENWDYSSLPTQSPDFLSFLITSGITEKVPADPINNATPDGAGYAYRYYCFPKEGLALGYRQEKTKSIVYYPIYKEKGWACL